MPAVPTRNAGATRRIRLTCHDTPDRFARMSNRTATTIADLPSMTNSELDALSDGLFDGSITASNGGELFDAALTERYREGRADRVFALTASRFPAARGARR